MSDSVKYGEELEENMDELEHEPKEVEIVGFKSKSDVASGEGKDFGRGRKERHSTGIAPKPCSKHDRGK